MKRYRKYGGDPLTLMVLLMLLLLSGPVQGAEDIKTVEVMGTGDIIHGNDSKARSQAIEDGLVSAVGFVVMDLLGPDAVVLNFDPLNTILYTHTDSFIQNYKVLTETKINNYYRVMVQVTVSLPLVRQKISDLGIIFDKAAKTIPKILLIIAEQRIQDISPQFYWGKDFTQEVKPAEQAMAQDLEKKGFVIIPHNDILLKQNMDTPLLSIDMDTASICQLGKRFEADLVLVGVARAQQTQNTLGTELKSFKGQVTIRGYKVATQSEIAFTSQVAVSAQADEFLGGNQALADAGRLAGEELAPKLKDAWLKSEQIKSTIEVVINGTRNLAHFVKFRRALKAIPGVEEVVTKEMQYDVTIISVDYQGSAKDLADNLLLRTIEGFGIEITQVEDNQISLTLTAH